MYSHLLKHSPHSKTQCTTYKQYCTLNRQIYSKHSQMSVPTSHVLYIGHCLTCTVDQRCAYNLCSNTLITNSLIKLQSSAAH